MNRIKRIGFLALTLIMMTVLLAPAIASASDSYVYRRLSYGDSGSDVVQLQKALKKLGYFSGQTKGNYLDMTQLAVKSYELAHGYKMTNYCTQSMQKHIYNASKGGVKAYRTLHYGDSGDDVKQLQKALKTLGYFKGTIGGNFLDKTRAAVKSFQSDFDYKVTNYCTASMQRRIRSLGK